MADHKASPIHFKDPLSLRPSSPDQPLHGVGHEDARVRFNWKSGVDSLHMRPPQYWVDEDRRIVRVHIKVILWTAEFESARAPGSDRAPQSFVTAVNSPSDVIASWPSIPSLREARRRTVVAGKPARIAKQFDPEKRTWELDVTRTA
jgi:hypothetical protein